PGSVTIPELIALDRAPYYNALEAADTAFRRTKQADVSVMETYLELLYVEQLKDVVPTDHPPVSDIRKRRTTWVKQSGYEREAALLFGNRNKGALFFLGATFAIVTLSFFIYLTLQHGAVTCDRRFPAVVVLALGAAIASGCMTGFATAQGDFTVDTTPRNVIKFSVGGGIATLVLCLLLGWELYRCDANERHEEQLERQRSPSAISPT